MKILSNKKYNELRYQIDLLKQEKDNIIISCQLEVEEIRRKYENMLNNERNISNELRKILEEKSISNDR